LQTNGFLAAARRALIRGLGAAACIAALVIGSPARAADGEFPVTLIGGVPCARGTLAGSKSIPASFLIDLGSTQALRVHERTGGMLALGGEATARVTLGAVELADLRSTQADGKLLEALTQEHSEELNEIPLVAILGLPAFAGRDVQLDLPAGVLRLLPASTDSIPAADRNTPALFTLPYLDRVGRAWLPITGPQDTELRAQLAALQWDTLIDATLAKSLDAPGGNVSTLKLGPLDLARELALRPEPPAGRIRADVTLGSGLLSSFRVTVSPAQQTVTFERVRETRFPAEEQAYFVARAQTDSEAIEKFLDEHAASRLANEAAEQLLAFRIADPLTSRAEIMKAVGYRARYEREDRRARTMMALADTVAQGTRLDKYLAAADILKAALPYAPRDMNARAGHEIQARLGYFALRRNDLAAARVHLLSAAFGLPRDVSVNLWLAELYERTGKATRAWSRYLEAAISREAPPEAFAGLDRLNRDPNFRATFTMNDAEELLEGRISDHHSAERFTRGAADRTPPVRLVELFTCLQSAPTMAPELAFNGLREYFAGTDVVLITYSVQIPERDPLASAVGVTRALFYGLDATPVAYFDGRDPQTQSGDESATEATYAAYRKAAEGGRRDSTPWQLTGDVRLSDGAIAGHIAVDGPTATGDLRVFIILCEKVVMAPGANGVVLHRNVARYGFSPADGYAVAPAAGRRTYEFKLATADLTADLERRLERAQKEGGFAFNVHPTYVDPRACLIAAFVQDATNQAVLVAGALDVRPRDGARP
jgi:hypothetical protein